jgi:predicted DNA binding CopG/RHH family protein
MKSEIMYADAPKDIAQSLLDSEEVIDDLPPPEQLVRKYPKTKITITLNSRSVAFFKQYAKQHNVKYQTMINDILDTYAQKYNERSPDFV